jgi:hypothetical protein
MKFNELVCEGKALYPYAFVKAIVSWKSHGGSGYTGKNPAISKLTIPNKFKIGGTVWHGGELADHVKDALLSGKNVTWKGLSSWTHSRNHALIFAREASTPVLFKKDLKPNEVFVSIDKLVNDQVFKASLKTWMNKLKNDSADVREGLDFFQDYSSIIDEQEVIAKDLVLTIDDIEESYRKKLTPTIKFDKSGIMSLLKKYKFVKKGDAYIRKTRAKNTIAVYVYPKGIHISLYLTKYMIGGDGYGYSLQQLHHVEARIRNLIANK